jgi:hypothetical protein
MNKRLQQWLVLVAVAASSMWAAGAALAVPYKITVADLHALQNNTSSFSGGNQLSTIDAITVLPNGLQIDVTWRVGEGTADPFVTYPGETFSRVVLGMNTNNESAGAGRLLSPPHDGMQWTLSTNTPVYAQPYLQTAPGWQYYQPAPGGYSVPADMSINMVGLNFVSDSIAPDGNGEIRANAFGIQMFGPAPALGQSMSGRIILTGVPEPSTALLVLVGAASMVVRARRRS